MGIADVKAAFNAGLAGKATCTSAAMGYVPDNRKMQRLTFTINTAGVVSTVTEDVAPGVDLARKAHEMAAAIAAEIGG